MEYFFSYYCYILIIFYYLQYINIICQQQKNFNTQIKEKREIRIQSSKLKVQQTLEKNLKLKKYILLLSRILFSWNLFEIEKAENHMSKLMDVDPKNSIFLQSVYNLYIATTKYLQKQCNFIQKDRTQFLNNNIMKNHYFQLKDINLQRNSNTINSINIDECRKINNFESSCSLTNTILDIVKEQMLSIKIDFEYTNRIIQINQCIFGCFSFKLSKIIERQPINHFLWHKRDFLQIALTKLTLFLIRSISDKIIMKISDQMINEIVVKECLKLLKVFRNKGHYFISKKKTNKKKKIRFVYYKLLKQIF